MSLVPSPSASLSAESNAYVAVGKVNSSASSLEEVLRESSVLTGPEGVKSTSHGGTVGGSVVVGSSVVVVVGGSVGGAGVADVV
mmetsp:Transcript_12550/g.27253  ORF Transcript_12550/g.27253 Transcript_12550/m.27253 type:complete len:84 (+) Transcript_12550:3-254(+)